MNLERYTQKSQGALLAAQQLAQEHHHQNIEPVHLALALLRQEDGVVPAIVTKVAGSVLALQQELENDLEGRSKVYGAGDGSRPGAPNREGPGGSRAVCQRHER